MHVATSDNITGASTQHTYIEIYAMSLQEQSAIAGHLVAKITDMMS